MIVPFLVSGFTNDKNALLWLFYRYLSMAKKYNLPIIAEEQYFRPVSFYKNQVKYVNLFKQNVVDIRFMYDIPKDSDLKKIQKYPIPTKIFNNLVKENDSINGANKQLISGRCTELEELLEKYLIDIEEKNNEKVDAIITIFRIPSLEHVAEKLNIPILQFEQGPFREPRYLKTSFLDFGHIYYSPTADERYEIFLKEHKQEKFNLLDNLELLSILLEESALGFLLRARLDGRYEMGIATGYTTFYPANMEREIDDLEMIVECLKNYKVEEMLMRNHPGDPYGATYKNFKIKADKSRSSLEFVLQCKRVVSLISNVNVEAALCGRTSYILGTHSFRNVSENDLKKKTLKKIDLEYLNFYCLCYLIPYEFAADYDYLRWRLTNPSEKEMFEKHLNFYLKKREIDPAVLDKKGIYRLKAMLECRGYDLNLKKLEENGEDAEAIEQIANKKAVVNTNKIEEEMPVVPADVTVKVLVKEILKRVLPKKLVNYISVKRSLRK